MTTTDLTTFAFDGSDVRVVTDGQGEPWFVAKDVCNILDLTNVGQAVAGLDEDEKSNITSADVGGIAMENGGRAPLIVSEAGLYSLVFRSRKPQARQFKRWVTHEVLPTIRRRGGYINPHATEHQVNALIRQAQMQMELCQAAKGLIHPDHLEAKARVVLARGLGERPEIDPARRPLYVQDYLRGMNLSKDRLRRVSGTFGKAVKRAYIDLHGVEPDKYDLDLSNGQVRSVYAYTEADRPLLDKVWREKCEAKAVAR